MDSGSQYKSPVSMLKRPDLRKGLFSISLGLLSISLGLSMCMLATEAVAAESTMPPQYAEIMNPEVSKLYKYSEDGEFSAACGLPTYQWMPSTGAPKAIIIGIHGLTLHGRRYRVLARTMSINEIGFVSMDMRGFGKCRFEDDGKLKAKGEKTSVDHESSYQDIVKLTQAVRSKYPSIPVVVLGESLGATFCVRIAGEHPELIEGIVMSGPAVRVNPKMYATPSDIKAGLKAILSTHHQVDLHNFFTELVSERPAVVNEMLDDPFICKSLSLKELLDTDLFVDKTVDWCKKTDDKLPVMVIQGSNDKCVLPKHLTDMMMHMKSNDMRICWKGSFGHLQLETMFMRAAVIDSIGMWLDDHSQQNQAKLKQLEKSIADLGGTLVQ